MSAPSALLRTIRLVGMVEVLPLALAIGGVWIVGVSALGVSAFVVMYLLTMLGIELGMHRMVAHRALRARAPVRALLCVLGSMAGEGSPLLWSAIHREHHRAPDAEGDPHSPTWSSPKGARRVGFLERVRGFVWSQSLWYVEQPGIVRFRGALARHLAGASALEGDAGDVDAARFLRVVDDWLRDPIVVRVDVLYPLWVALGFVIPAVACAGIAGLVGDDVVHGALVGLVWGGLVRAVAVQKISFAVNSVGHTIGARSMQTKDDSRNNVFMAVLTLGSGWHNNHHAFPSAASVRFRWWQLDPSGAFIWVLEKVGLVDEVRRTSREAIEARRAR